MEEQKNELIEQDMEETLDENAIVDDEIAILPENEKTQDTADDAQEEESEEDFPKELTLRFRISPEDYFQFQCIMSLKQMEKNRKRTSIMNYVEIILGVVFCIFLLVTKSSMGITSYVLSAMLILMGVYGIVYYKYFFEKSLRKSVFKQYGKLPYLQNEIVVDFYPNRCVEYDGDIPVNSYWHKIIGVRETENHFIIQLEKRRCLFIPKGSIPEQIEVFSDFLTRICENFEKPRNLQ